MADRYWVGGTATWDTTAGTKWASTSGGTGGQSVPTIADDVFFNAASGTVTCTVDVAFYLVKSLDFTGYTGTITSPAYGGTIYGNLILSPTMTISGTLTWNFAAAFANGAPSATTLTTNGKTLTGSIYLDAVGSVTLTDALTLSGTLGIGKGTFNTSNNNVTASVLNVVTSVGSARTVNLSNSTITLSSGTPLSIDSTNLTFNCNTSIITCTATSPTFAGGGQTFATVNFTSTGASTRTITGGNTFTNLSFTSRTSDGLNVITFDSNQTVSGTLTLGAGNTAVRRMYVQSSTLGTQRTLTVGTLATLSDVDFSDIVAAGASGTWSGTRIGDCKNNSNITFTTAKTVYLASTSGANTNWSGVSWANSTGGTAAVTNFPLAQDTAIIDDSGATTGNGLRTGFTVTMDAGWNLGTVTSTRTNAYTLYMGNSDPNIFGNITLTSALTFGGLSSPTWTFSGQNITQTITTNGKTIALNNINVNSPGGTVKLLDALTLTFSPTSTTSTFFLTAGTLDLNGFTLTPIAFSSTGSGVRAIAFGSTGKIVTAGGAGTSQTVFTTSTSGNLTVTGSANVECFLTSGYNNTATTRTIAAGGSATEANALNISLTGSGIDTVALANSCNFRDLNTSGHGTGGVLFLGTTFTSYGNLTLGTGTTVTTSNPTSHIQFASTSGTKTITTNGVALNKALTFNGVGGTWEVQNALSISSGTVTLTNGTLKLKSGAINDISTFATSGTTQKFLQSTTPGTQTTLRTANTGLNDTLTFDYLTLQDINANTSPDTRIYYAGLNSTSNGNVTGWTFTRGEFLQMMF